MSPSMETVKRGSERGECSGTGCGLRFTAETCGSKREKTAFREMLQGVRFVLLQKCPNISRKLLELEGTCNLGILYSSSLLREPCERDSRGLLAVVTSHDDNNNNK